MRFASTQFSGARLPSRLIATGLLLASSMVIWSAGCSHAPHGQIEVVRNVQHKDIPDPQGALFDPESWDYQKFATGPCAMRSSQIIYWKDAPINHLANWYMEVMPPLGWKHVRTDDGEKVRLVFTKNTEEAAITLEQAIAREREGYITKITVDLGVH